MPQGWINTAFARGSPELLQKTNNKCSPAGSCCRPWLSTGSDFASSDSNLTPTPGRAPLGKACRSDRLSSKGEVPLVTQWAEARHAKNPTIHKKLRQRIENYLKMTIMPRLRNSVIDKELPSLGGTGGVEGGSQLEV